MAWYHWFINPVRAIGDLVNGTDSPVEESIPGVGQLIKTGKDAGEGLDNAGQWLSSEGSDIVDKVWNDVTGQTAIDQQFQANKELADYQTEMQKELYEQYSSPAAIMRQYKEAGLNPNLMYSSAGSGQGNVPSYAAPSAPRRLSFGEQLLKGISLVQGLLNLESLRYNADASRELSEQAGVKTLGLLEDLKKKRQDNALRTEIYLYNGGDIAPLYHLSSLGRRRPSFTSSLNAEPSALETLGSALYSMKLNQAQKAYDSNLLEYNRGYGLDGLLSTGSYDFPNSYYRNKILQYDYKNRQFENEWNQDYRTLFKSLGIASPVAQGLLKLFVK